MKKCLTILLLIIGATVKSGSSSSWEESTVTYSSKKGTKYITRTFVYSKESHKKPVKKQITTVTTIKNDKVSTETKVKKVKKFKSIKVVPNGEKKKKTEDDTYKK